MFLGDPVCQLHPRAGGQKQVAPLRGQEDDLLWQVYAKA